MATFGHTTQEASWNALSGNDLQASGNSGEFTPATAGTLSSITAYLDGGGSGSNANLRFGCYSDSSTYPAAKVAETSQGTVVLTAAAAWVTLNTTTNPAISTSPYWLSIHVSTGAARIAYTNSGDTLKFGSSAYGGSEPDPFPAAFSSSTAFQYSIYATYTAAGASFIPRIVAVIVQALALPVSLLVFASDAAIERDTVPVGAHDWLWRAAGVVEHLVEQAARDRDASGTVRAREHLARALGQLHIAQHLARRERLQLADRLLAIAG